MHPHFLEALQNLDYVEYLVEEFMFCSDRLVDETPNVNGFLRKLREVNA